MNTALSVVGANMYSACLGARNVSVTLPSQAYSEKDFFINVKWTPQYEAPEVGKLTVLAIGGMIDGQKKAEYDVKKFKDETLSINRTDGPLQLAIRIDGIAYQPYVYLPAIKPIKKLKIRKVYGTGDASRTAGGDTCSDHAYLVSEVGAAAGDAPKTCQLCIVQPQNGIILRDSARFEDNGLSQRGSHREIVGSATELCAHYWTDGAGQKSGRFEVFNAAKFSALVAEPE